MLGTSRSSRRRLVGALALGAALSIGPVTLLVVPADAGSPAVSVMGLAQGSRGDAVRAVQQALVNQGIAIAGGVDGIFGAATTNALKQFQQRDGLATSGTVDQATALALGLATSPLLGLTQGARGDAVTTLQQKLLAIGVSVPGGADGVFGAGTTAALKQYQKGQGLSPSGTVDAPTAAALGSVQATSGGSSPSTSTSTTRPPTTSVAPGATAAAAAGSLVGLKLGSRGAAVTTLQQRLVAAGYPVLGGPDGVFGVLTANALAAFQQSVGLKGTAVVDDATATALTQGAGGSGTGSGSGSSGSGTGGSSGGSGAGSGSTGATSPLLGLEYGATGAKVKQLQQTLIAAGVPVTGGVDGVFGASTRTALKQYQTAAGLPATGKVDEKTASALASGKKVTVGGGSGAGTPAASPIVGLKAGRSGDAVKQLQQKLIKAGVSLRGGADGIFGPATAAALKSFQTSQGLAATGIVDDATAKALDAPKPAGGGSGGGSATAAGFAQYGERGDRVVALQEALVRAGITLRGGVDGMFGSGTTAAIMDFQRAKGLPINGKVDAATAAKLGLTATDPPKPPEPVTVTFDVFPVQGVCGFADTWHAPRSGGRLHEGVDIIAAQGKLIYAVADGTITKIYTDHPGSLSGNGVRLTMADGTYFFFAHMSKLGDGIELGTKVKAGQTIGYIGRTGNTTTNHLHFEVHPKGGAAVNPYPLVKAIDACDVTAPRG